MRRSRVSQAGVIEHETVKIRVVRVEETSVVERVVILNESADLNLMADPSFDNSAKGISRCSLG